MRNSGIPREREGLENSVSCAAVARVENRNIPWDDGVGEHWGKWCLWKGGETGGVSQLLQSSLHKALVKQIQTVDETLSI